MEKDRLAKDYEILVKLGFNNPADLPHTWVEESKLSNFLDSYSFYEKSLLSYTFSGDFEPPKLKIEG
jgi:hypothetical protein